MHNSVLCQIRDQVKEMQISQISLFLNCVSPVGLCTYNKLQFLSAGDMENLETLMKNLI